MHLVGDVPEEIALQHTIVVHKGMAVAEVDIMEVEHLPDKVRIRMPVEPAVLPLFPDTTAVMR